MTELQEIWQRAYEIVPTQLRRMSEVECAVTAFNTNIDAVVKISGLRLAELAREVGLTAADLHSTETKLKTPKDVVRGIIKCFASGIAEEWLCEDKRVFEWMRDNLGYDRLQMGGQAGIVANVLAVAGVQKVLAHTNSHPRLQAEQFVDAENLLATENDGTVRKACAINRAEDEPLIHWIIEFDAGDVAVYGDEVFVCPKANRFIATYDTANIELKINAGFVNYLNQNGFDYMILSGFHALTAERGGVERIAAVVPLIHQWKKQNPTGIIHLEVASTQDKIVRAAIMNKLAPIVDSIGLNEREAMDALEVVEPEMFAALEGAPLPAPVLFDVMLKLKEKLKTPRIQLHFFGMYMTLQNKGFVITPQANKRGMMLAATVAASKAGTGSIESRDNLLWAHGMPISTAGEDNMHRLSWYLAVPEIETDGITSYDDMDLIAVPTILVDKPKTLVGMGDTISSVSLVGAR
ncbi:MAG: ADP-dependent glucokinase/phosphofructokinase [Alphaproteobacteria bacterium]|nr:ADP-dependent glucokinase/phosphofructokinase [Alphaproteobacteria bacterium]